MTKPSILLLHGFLGDRHDFDDVIGHLIPVFRPHTLNLPGHGQPPEPLPPCAVDLTALSNFLKNYLSRHNLHRPYLYGYSLGGRIALNLALNHPDLISGLILESASPGIGPDDKRTQRRLLDHKRADQIVDNLPAFLDHWYSLPLFGDLKTHPTYPAMLDRRRQNSPHLASRLIRELSPGQQPDLTPRLPTLQVPTLWLYGQDDPKYSTLTPDWATQSPQTTPQAIADAAHNAHLQNPRSVADAILRFHDHL